MRWTCLRRASLRVLLSFFSAVVVGFTGGLLFSRPPDVRCLWDGPQLEAVRVVCAVGTRPGGHRGGALAVKETWGQRCSELLFFSTQLDAMLPTVALNASAGRRQLWKAALSHCWQRGALARSHWLISADDDAYVVLENLRRLLQPLDPEQALYLGLPGGAGCVLSRGAVRSLVATWDQLPVMDKEDDPALEDVHIGWWMDRVGARFVDTTDECGRRRFHGFPPSRELSPGSGMGENDAQVSDCCSDSAISFHNLSAAGIRAMEYLLYEVNVYGHGWCLPDYGQW